MRTVERLLAEAGCLTEISEDHLSTAIAEHAVALERLHTGCVRLYRRFLEHCLVDQAVSDEEASQLAHLRRLLRLQPDAVARVHRDVAHEVYGRAIEQVLEDQRLDPEEEQFLRRLREDLDLPEEEAEILFRGGVERARRRFIGNLEQDPFVPRPRDYVVEVTGSSQESLEHAVRTTLEQAGRAIPGIYWAEVSKIGVALDGKDVAAWHVKVAARRSDEDGPA